MRETTEQDEHEVRDLIARTFQAWGRGDADAYVADMTEDADYVAFDGSRRGKAGTRAWHDELFRTVLYGTRLEGEVESVRFVTPDVAVVHAVGSVAFAWQQTLAKGRASRQTLVAVRRDGKWQLTAFHNTRVRPRAAGGVFFRFFARVVRWRTERVKG